MERIRKRHIAILIILLKLSLISVIILKYFPEATEEDLRFNQTFFWFLLAGFLAQFVDGCLGMAYGVTSNSVLLGFGMSPKVASAAVHTAEIFTTGVSGLSHMRFGNFDKKLFFRIVIPGTAGAALGSYILGDVLDGNFIKPYITAYLLVLGLLILRKTIKNSFKEKATTKNAPILALIGSFLDAIGGGGWGPIVTSNLINQGNAPDAVIGTVNTAEFFVTFVSASVLIHYSGIQSWQIILGLIIGGTIAAPLGAYITKKIPKRTLLFVVGSLIVIVSAYSLVATLLQK